MEKESSFHHISVLLQESIAALEIKPDGVYVDATMGGAGHSREILKYLGPKGKLIAFDHDEDAWPNAIEDSRFTLVKENFRYMAQFLDYLGTPKVDGILADLGVSSHQFDTAGRGFSIRYDAALDMRMDQRLELTAADIVNTYTAGALQKIFEQYGQVRNAKTLAQCIVDRRTVAPIHTIQDFKKILESLSRGNPNKYLAQVFQALRIAVNEELEALETFLKASVACLAKDGRLCVISFHSLEDKIVKHFMKSGGVAAIEQDLFGRRTTTDSIKMIADIIPSEKEIKENSRSRSARLRVAKKL